MKFAQVKRINYSRQIITIETGEEVLHMPRTAKNEIIAGIILDLRDQVRDLTDQLLKIQGNPTSDLE